MKGFVKEGILILLLLACFPVINSGQQNIPKDGAMVQKFYALIGNDTYWLSSARNVRKAKRWLHAVESAGSYLPIQDKILFDETEKQLNRWKETDISKNEITDRKITSVILNFLKDLQEGDVDFDYDEINIPGDSIYIDQLRHPRRGESISKMIARLDCNDKEYLVLKKFLLDSLKFKSGDDFKTKTVLLAMNYRRYIAANQQVEYIIVNIPAAEVEYYKNNRLSIKMKAVVGRIKNPTPAIASYITTIVTFPPWNVPYSIAVKEILPKVRQDEKYLEQNSFDVVDAKGNPVDDTQLNWEEFNETNFPYYFRQSSGTNNSLGVIKFNMQNPFSIFLHATSWQGVFAKKFRFLSHGCIRLEKPFDLADSLLTDSIDIVKLKRGEKNGITDKIVLPHKIPVFIIYVPLTVTDNKIVFLDDVYKSIK